MQDEFSTSRAQIRADIDVCMGGRVAEELVYGADQVGFYEGVTVPLCSAQILRFHKRVLRL